MKLSYWYAAMTKDEVQHSRMTFYEAVKVQSSNTSMYSCVDPPEADAFPELEQNRMFPVKAPVDESFRLNPDKRDSFQYPFEG